MKRRIMGACLAVALMSSGASMAQADDKGAEELAVEGLSKLIDALSVFIDSIPQYETPTLLENGDIIIRRKQNDEEEEKEDRSPDVEKTAM